MESNGRCWPARNFSTNLYLLRHFLELDRKQLAKRLGYDESTISRFESGSQRFPAIEELARIARFFGTTSGKLRDVNSEAYLKYRNLYMFVNRASYLEYPPGEVLNRNPQMRSFIEQSFF